MVRAPSVESPTVLSSTPLLRMKGRAIYSAKMAGTKQKLRQRCRVLARMTKLQQVGTQALVDASVSDVS